MSDSKTSEKVLRKSALREAINNRVIALGLTRHQFANSGHLKAAPSTIYRFLNGEVETTSGNIDEMLACLNLRIENGTRPAWAKEAKKERLDRLADLGRDPANSIAVKD